MSWCSLAVWIQMICSKRCCKLYGWPWWSEARCSRLNSSQTKKQDQPSLITLNSANGLTVCPYYSVKGLVQTRHSSITYSNHRRGSNPCSTSSKDSQLSIRESRTCIRGSLSRAIRNSIVRCVGQLRHAAVGRLVVEMNSMMGLKYHATVRED